jgi:hypothetical protein
MPPTAPKVRHYLGVFLWKEKSSDYAFKLECVKLVLEKCYSCNYVSVEGIERSNLANGLGL